MVVMVGGALCQFVDLCCSSTEHSLSPLPLLAGQPWVSPVSVRPGSGGSQDLQAEHSVRSDNRAGQAVSAVSVLHLAHTETQRHLQSCKREI